ncbi:hypothetical protein EOZ79_21010 [Escherichia coli]|nr:hypothetical protein [Escherichia coli]
MRKVTSLSRGKLPFFFFALRKLELTMSIESLNAFSMDFFSLKGKTAIVTGGNSGLGQAFAMALAKAGANIFIPREGANKFLI